MVRQLLLVVGEEGAFGAGLLVVHFVHVGGEPLRSCRLVFTKRARERLEVRVEVPFQAPIVDARPRAVAASVTSLALRHTNALFGGQLDDMFRSREGRGLEFDRSAELPFDGQGRRAQPEPARVRELAGTPLRLPPAAYVVAVAVHSSRPPWPARLALALRAMHGTRERARSLQLAWEAARPAV